jgi:hypothetical protein
LLLSLVFSYIGVGFYVFRGDWLFSVLLSDWKYPQPFYWVDLKIVSVERCSVLKKMTCSQLKLLMKACFVRTSHHKSQ